MVARMYRLLSTLSYTSRHILRDYHALKFYYEALTFPKMQIISTRPKVRTPHLLKRKKASNVRGNALYIIQRSRSNEKGYINKLTVETIAEFIIFSNG